MFAVKNNKQYTIDEKQIKSYQDAGFDILGDEGEILHHGRGKKVPFEELEALRQENEALKEGKGKEADNQDVVDILKAFAQEHEIDLGKSTAISAIVKKIKEHDPEPPKVGE